MTSFTSQQLAHGLVRAPADLDMPVHRPVYCAVALVAADGIAAAAAMFGIFWCKGVLHGTPMLFAPPGSPIMGHDLMVLLAAMFGYFTVKGRYVERIAFWRELRMVVSASFFIAMLQAAFGLLMHGAVAFGPVLAVFPLFTVLAILANHGARRLLVHVASWTIPVVILGNGAAAAVAEAAVNADRSLGYHVVGRMDPAAMMASATAPTLLPVLKRFGGSRLLIALDGAEKLQRQLIEGALREGLPFGVVQQPGAFPAFAADTTQFFNHETTLVSCRSELSRPLSQVMKAVMDVGLAALLLILMAPLFIMLTVACRRDGGPAIFAHRRVGVGGRSFPCLKFRTMVVNGAQVLEEALASDPALAEEWAATRKLTHDPRVTPIGRFLRKTSLDELPQLINVLIRQMSLVGPRPIVEAEIHLYGKDIAHYYATRPGLTGLWQVSGRSNTSYARRVELDVRYVTNWTIWHDLVVLLKTIPAVLRRDGAC